MKRRNTRPGRRLQARGAGGGGALPFPLQPDSGPPRLIGDEGGLYAPTHSDARRGPVLFGHGSVQASRSLRSGRPSSARPEPALAQVARAMSAWEAYGMRLMVN